ncbi:hypothetical protein [uncultured Ruminococcus sp.]|uniref:hypothetical protein n=1 Tax=uncultured Ruminococcus sp. TaxID=165186 RepID=UPI0025D30710|nr:hypothetical protein [uncultured Ruminococcus sp.]
MKNKKIIIAIMPCIIAAAVAVFFAVKPDNNENNAIPAESDTSSAETVTELITDTEEIKSLIDSCIEENGYELGVRVGIGDSQVQNGDTEPNRKIVIVTLSVDRDRRSEIEHWDAYLNEIADNVLECVSENNIDRDYVVIDQLESA